MIKFTLTSEMEERMESLQERMADRGVPLDIEQILEMVLDQGLRAAEQAINVLAAFDPEEEE